MDLFQNTRAVENILPKDGQLFYFSNFFSSISANAYYNNLMSEIAWENDTVHLFGKKYITKRKTAWYGDTGLAYTYSGNTRKAFNWQHDLLKIKEKIEKDLKETFNACLLNLYHDGSEGMSWHSDNEKELGHKPSIASVSFGAPRKFSFKHKIDKDRHSVMLENGSLLLMKGAMQDYWLHCIPKTSKVVSPRINLTFRKINI